MTQDTKEDLVTLEFDMELVLNGSTTVLKDGFRPGGFLKQTVAFTVPRDQVTSPRLTMALDHKRREFLQKNVSVILDAPRILPA